MQFIITIKVDNKLYTLTMEADFIVKGNKKILWYCFNKNDGFFGYEVGEATTIFEAVKEFCRHKYGKRLVAIL